MEEWVETTVGQIAELKYGRSLPSRDRIDGNIPVYGSGGIGGYHNQPLVKKGIIIGRKGTVGSVRYSNVPFFPIDTVFYIENVKKGNSLKFLFYYLQTIGLNQFDSDAAVPGLNRNLVHRLRGLIPAMQIQQGIATSLSAYDDLIEVNNQRIKLLEETAKEIYKEWFVRMRFPGYKDGKFVKGIPRNWEIKKMKEYCNFKYGTMPNTKLIRENGFPIFSGYGIVGFYERCMFEKKTLIVVARGVGGTGDIKLTPLNCWLTNLSIAILPDEINLLKYFLYYTLSAINLRYLDSGSAQSQITIADIGNLKLLIPDVKLQTKFEEIIIPIENQIENLHQQNAALRQIRNQLLPRLISGKLKVKEFNNAATVEVDF